MKVYFDSIVPIRWLFRLVIVAAFSCLPLSLKALDVWVTLEPQAFFVEQIGGDAVTVRVLVPPGRSPATYAPTPAEVRELTGSALFFGIGVPAEKRLLQRLSGALRRVRVVESDTWRRPLAEAAGTEASTHHHDGDACSAESTGDPHLWMDPLQMIAFSGRVAEELSVAKPEAAAGFRAREAQLRAQLEKLDTEIRENLSAFVGHAFFINHASLGHFAARYGLTQHPVEQAGSRPSARHVAAMVEKARGARVGAILAQVQFPRSTADVLAKALDVPVLKVDPLRRDYPANLRSITEILQRALTPTTP